MKTIPIDLAYTGFSVAHASEYTTTSNVESATSRTVLEDQADHSKTHSQSGKVRLLNYLTSSVIHAFIYYYFS